MSLELWGTIGTDSEEPQGSRDMSDDYKSDGLEEIPSGAAEQHVWPQECRLEHSSEEEQGVNKKRISDPTRFGQLVTETQIKEPDTPFVE